MQVRIDCTVKKKLNHECFGMILGYFLDLHLKCIGLSPSTCEFVLLISIDLILNVILYQYCCMYEYAVCLNLIRLV